jgi:hypothetical protein
MGGAESRPLPASARGSVRKCPYCSEPQLGHCKRADGGKLTCPANPNAHLERAVVRARPLPKLAKTVNTPPEES